MKQVLLILILTCAASLAPAQVYEWVDENGKKHFSDKAPLDPATDVKESQYDIENIDEGYPAPVVSNPKSAEQEAREAHRKKVTAYRQNKACNKAKRRLHKIRGRVTYWDDDGKEVYVSENDRKQEVAQLSAAIDKHCD